MLQKAKKILMCLDDRTGHILTASIPDMLYTDLKIELVVQRLTSWLYCLDPSLSGPACKTKKQKRTALLGLLLIVVLLRKITGGVVNPIAIFGCLPFMDYFSFTENLEGAAAAPLLVYIFYGTLSIGLDTLILKLIQRFVTGKLEDKFLSLDGFLEALFNLYTFALCGSLLQPLMTWYAFHAKTGGGWQNYLSLSGIFAILCVIVMMVLFVDSVENLGAIYFSAIFFKLFIGLKLHYVVSFFLVGMEYIVHRAVFSDSNLILTVLCVVLMQITLDFLKRFRIYNRMMKCLKFLCTTVGGILSLPFLACIAVGILLILRR